MSKLSKSTVVLPNVDIYTRHTFKRLIWELYLTQRHLVQDFLKYALTFLTSCLLQQRSQIFSKLLWYCSFNNFNMSFLQFTLTVLLYCRTFYVTLFPVYYHILISSRLISYLFQTSSCLFWYFFNVTFSIRLTNNFFAESKVFWWLCITVNVTNIFYTAHRQARPFGNKTWIRH